MRIANLIEAGACCVNGDSSRAGYRVVLNDAVEISFEEGAPTAMSAEPIALEIIHEDEHMMLVVKPAGMLVHPTRGVKTGTLANALAYHLNKSRIEDGGWRIESLDESIDPRSSILNPLPVIRPGIVHRLDRATSGLMVIAKTSRALAVLSRHFRKRLVEKRYLALVHKTVQDDLGSIDAPIGRDPDRLPRWGVMEGGKPAETRFRVLERLGGATFLELQPVTGRTNQLRIHCAHMGHPIVGDELHGNFGLRSADCGLNAEAAISDQAASDQQSAICESQTAIPLCLHAWKLSFHHPATGEWMEFSSPLPDEITALIEELRDSQSS